MKLYQAFFDLMQQGGPVMWVIFFVALAAVVMLLWQAWRVRVLGASARRDYQSLVQNRSLVRLPLKGGRLSPIAELLSMMNWLDIGNKAELVKEMNIHFAEIAPRLEGVLPTIATLGSLLPMLGLLGTVTGMINVFEAIALHGSGKPEQMAYGISQALLTTASGLIIAIPVIFLHHLLARRVNSLAAVTGQAMQVILHRDLEQLRKAYSV
jgi:biopolymer transport protein ExbB